MLKGTLRRRFPKLKAQKQSPGASPGLVFFCLLAVYRTVATFGAGCEAVACAGATT